MDAWIAEHVMGLRLNENGSIETWPRAGVRHDLCVDAYSTDPAAAMRVLEKCAEKLMQETGLSIYKITTGYAICCDDTEDIIAETLPFAICLFAKQLFQAVKLT